MSVLDKAKLAKFLENAITVDELKEMLDDFEGDMKVVFSYNYGDHWNTAVAENIGEVEDNFIKYSDYHRKAKVSEEGFKEEDSEKVLVIS